MVIDLADGTSMILSGVAYSYYPRRTVRLEVTLAQTPGATAVDPENIDMFGVHHVLHFTVQEPLSKTTCLALIGRNISFINQWILDEWAKFKVQPDTCEIQLRNIFEYVAMIGVKA